MLYSRVTAAAIALFILSGPAAAQTELSGSIAVSSASMFRGVTDTNRPVLEADASVLTRWSGLDLVAGGWLAVEPKAYRGANEISLLGDAARPGVTQGSLWLDATRSFAMGSATLGATSYLYPAAADLAATYNTMELYGSVWLDAPLSPSVTLYYDVLKIRGAYLEGGVEHALVASDRGDLTVGAVGGWSLGQAMGDDEQSTELGYFAGNGFTHTELFVRTNRDVGALTLGGTAHLILGRDGYTRIVAPEQERGAKLWIGVSVGWSSAPGGDSADGLQP